ncbi:unnamed protein product [Rotaria socialis]|nr:unnamed protein product [Rotaria socialis]
MLPQEEALNILIEFLNIHGYTKVKGIPLETIRLLASIVLKENVFVYGKKMYQQVLGGAMGSSFTLTLANIFMWKWQKELVRRQDMTGEYYGRYIDDVFMTWNKSENELKKVLDNANTWHPNIKLEYKIGKSLPFLDILLTNINGTLSTSVYHKPAAEPYVVPFISDHPRHVFENIVQTSLRRAIKYSSTFQLFNDERRYIKSTFLYNGYPSSFIDKIFRKFFSGYISSRSFLPFLDNEAQFLQMRIALSGQPSRQQSQVEMRIATLTTDNEHLIEELEKKQEATIQEKKKPNKFQNKLIIHYTHEKRFKTRKRDLHRIFQETFANTSILETKLIVGNRNQKSTMKELIRKRPRQAILKNKAKPSRLLKKQELRLADLFVFSLRDRLICFQLSQLTQLLNKLNYSKLQNEQWTYYYNLGMTEGIWSGRVSKKIANDNSMCYTYGRSKTLIEQRKQKYKQQFEQIQKDINEYMKQPLVLIDMGNVMNIINNFIHKDQYQLRVELQRRRTMLQFDAKEHRLVHDFYQLKPRQTEIHSAKIIWKATHDEQTMRHEIALFKNSFSSQTFPTSYTSPNIQLPQINQLLTQLVFQIQHTSPNELAIHTLAKAEQMAQSYGQIASNKTNQLLNTRCNHKSVTLFDTILTQIVNRQQNMIQRAQYDIEKIMLTLSSQHDLQLSNIDSL